MTLASFARSLVLVATTFAAAATPAAAQPAAPSWTGFYVGIDSGYAWSASNGLSTSAANLACASFGGACGPGSFGQQLATASVLGATSTLSIPFGGVAGGALAGYNWQAGPAFVVGVETDFHLLGGAQGTASTMSALPVPFGPSWLVTSLTARKSVASLGTVRLRAGYLALPDLLLYATGGLAYGHVGSRFDIFQTLQPPVGASPSVVASGGKSGMRLGFALGAGLEWLFASNWSLKAEYLYFNLGRLVYPSGPLTFAYSPDGLVSYVDVVQAHTRIAGHTVRIGLNYHFF